MVFGPAGFQKIIYNHCVILYKSWLSHRFIIGQSKYKFKGVFHGEKESHQINFKKETCAEESGLKGKTGGEKTGQESTGDPTENRSQVKTGAQAGKKGGAKENTPQNQTGFGEGPFEEKI